jgi:hypothetical protein
LGRGGLSRLAYRSYHARMERWFLLAYAVLLIAATALIYWSFSVSL